MFDNTLGVVTNIV